MCSSSSADALSDALNIRYEHANPTLALTLSRSGEETQVRIVREMMGGAHQWIVSIIAAVGVLYIAVGFYWTLLISIVAGWLNLSGASAKPSRNRRMSTVTNVLARGGFPPGSNIPDANMHSIMWFENAPKKSNLIALFEEVLRVPAYVNFRSNPELSSNGTLEWKETPLSEFNLHDRFFEKDVESEKDIISFCEEIAAISMNPSDPLWEIHILRNKGPGRSAIVSKIHHCIGDGLAMLGLFNNFFKDEDGNALSLPEFSKSKKSHPKKNSSKIGVLDFIGKAIAATLKVLSLPNSRNDTSTKFKDPTGPQVYSGRRKLLISNPVDVSFIKEIKNKAKCTLNDVFASALSGAVRRYLEYRQDSSLGESFSSFQMRALFPYAFPRSLDPSQTSSALRNLWVLVSASLCVGIPSDRPLDRLKETKKVFDYLKSSPEAYIQYYVQTLASKILPFKIQSQTNLDIMLGHSMVFTNVPGPDKEVFFGGEKLLEVDIFVPNCLPQVSGISYNGKLSVTWFLDDNIVREPEKLGEFFHQELHALNSALKE